MRNEWSGLAKKEGRKEGRIQGTKNRVLNPKLFALIARYVSRKGTAFDYGCGWGEFAGLLSKRGFTVHAFDAADEMVARAKKKYKAPQFYTSAVFMRMFPRFREKYDLVISNLVLCILKRHDQDALLDNVKKILKPNGTIILSFCHPSLDYIMRGIVSKRMRPWTPIPHYDKEFKYKKVIHENGLEFSDYHRPLAYYVKLFKRHSLKIIDIAESNVLKTDLYPDFIIFVLRK